MSQVEFCLDGKYKKKMKRSGSPVLSSFFKVLIGHQFSDFLFIPPKFARTISAHANQTVHLNDPTGRQWQVTVSEHDGSYAFLGGWNSFSIDHGLEIGDFLVFFYLGSCFLVKIYDKSGCEKQDLLTSKKRRRTTVKSRHKTSESPDLSSRNKCSTNNQASNGLGASDAPAELSHCCSERNGIKAEAGVSTPLYPYAKGCTEELLCVADRGIGCVVAEEFRAAFDLSNFEMYKENNVLLKRCQMLAGNSNKLVISRGTSQACAAETKETGTTCPGERPMLIQSEQQLISQGSSQPMQLQILAGVDDTLGAVTAEEEGGLKMRSSLLVRSVDHNFLIRRRIDIKSGEESEEDAKERIDWLEQVGITSNFDAYARRDPLSSFAANCSCTVKITAVCRKTLDLPGNLPAEIFRGGKNKDRRMLFLQDPMQRLWPVVYQENDESRFLSHGWEGFHNAHNLKPGDDCIFKVSDKTKAFFGVCIIRR